MLNRYYTDHKRSASGFLPERDVTSDVGFDRVVPMIDRLDEMN